MGSSGCGPNCSSCSSARLAKPPVSSLECNDCVEGLKILLDDHLSQGSVEGQTQILSYELCASPDAPSDCAEEITFFWPLFAGQLWPYLLDSSILCTQFCPAQRTLRTSCEECELVMNQLGDFITSENTIRASGMLLEEYCLHEDFDDRCFSWVDGNLERALGVLIQSGRDQYYHSECIELFGCAEKV